MLIKLRIAVLIMLKVTREEQERERGDRGETLSTTPLLDFLCTPARGPLATAIQMLSLVLAVANGLAHSPLPAALRHAKCRPHREEAVE